MYSFYRKNYVNFDKEYNKLLKKIDEYKTEYESNFNILNIKSLIYLLDEHDIFSESDKAYFNKFFNIFVLNKNQPNEQKYIPFIKEEKICKLKRKQLLKYLHPDKILFLYGDTFNIKFHNYFSEFMKFANNNLSSDSETLLEKICKDNEEVFDTVTNKLFNDKFLSNNEIKSIRSIAKNKLYYDQHLNNNTTKYNVYSIFPLEVIMFVELYETLKNEIPMQRFKGDIIRILSAIYRFLEKNCKLEEINKVKIKNENYLPNIMQLFKLSDMTKCTDVMLILKLYLPNSYAKIIDIFNVCYYKNTGIKIFPKISVSIYSSDFNNDIEKDFLYGCTIIAENEIHKLKAIFQQNLNELLEKKGSLTEIDKINVIMQEMIEEIRKFESCKMFLLKGIDELSDISQFI